LKTQETLSDERAPSREESDASRQVEYWLPFSSECFDKRKAKEPTWRMTCISPNITIRTRPRVYNHNRSDTEIG